MDNKAFKGSLGTYKPLKTDDGSISLYSSVFDETCHSQNGAVIETNHVYIEGALISEHFETNKKINIFEVGFGAGIGLSTTLNFFNNNYTDPSYKLHFVSCEVDLELVRYGLNNFIEKGILTSYKQYNNNGLEYISSSPHPSVQITILLGCIRKSLPLWKKHSDFQLFDRIYQDPFSPKNNPLLWTQEWFKELHEVSSDQAILSTYSSTRAAWKSLLNTNWHVETFKGVGKKKLCTRALKQGPTSKEIYELCKNSPKEEYRDRDYLKA